MPSFPVLFLNFLYGTPAKTISQLHSEHARENIGISLKRYPVYFICFPFAIHKIFKNKMTSFLFLF